MVESRILEVIGDALINLKSNPENPKSAPLFRKVIANNAPIWTAVEVTPSACFYLSDTTYMDSANGLRYNGNAQLKIYVYNKHKARGLSLKDILSPYIDAIRAEVNKLDQVDASILNAFVSKVSRDGGTVLPYTIAEITVDIEFTELKSCN